MNPFDFVSGPSLAELESETVKIRSEATAFASNPDRALDFYRADPGAWEGSYISGDDLMRVLPASTEHSLLKYAFAGQALAALPKRLFRQRLALPKASNEERVLFTMGMPATGKTTLVRGGFNTRRFHAVVDSPLGDFTTARDWQQEVEKSGRQVSFVLAFRPLHIAVQGMLERALPHNEGRTVTLLDLADLVGKCLSTFLQLAEMNRYDPGTTLDLVEVVKGRRVWRFGRDAVVRARQIREELRSIPEPSILHRIARLWIDALVFARQEGWPVPRILLDLAMDGINREYLLETYAEALASGQSQQPGPLEPPVHLPANDPKLFSQRIQSLSELPTWADHLATAASLADAHEDSLRGWRAQQKG